MKKALTIAGSDSGGGAGIQADLKTFSAFGVYGMTVVTSVTAQNTQGVYGIYDLPVEFVELQLDSVLRDIGIDAVKTGMLSDTSIVEMVAERLRERELRKCVVDPVMISKSRHFLLKPEARDALKTKLVPSAYVLTPNIPEAQLITEIEIRDEDGMRKAARILWKMGAKNVVIKGGHLKGKSIDVLFDGKNFHRYEHDRFPARHTHGTGCTFAAAIASCLALGMELGLAVEKAKEFVLRAIVYGLDIGHGTGPANHLFPIAMAEEASQLQRKLIDALNRLKRARIGPLIPEVRSNFVAALSRALSPEDVIGFPGRIHPRGDDIFNVSPPSLGGSRHMASVLLAAMRHKPSIKSGINLGYFPEFISALRSKGLAVAELDRKKEPKKVREAEGASLEWGTSHVIKKLGKVPDVIYDKGAVGKEAMVRVLGKDPNDVAKKVIGAWTACRKNIAG
ncbi:MAG: bifunctional hydroxymethylpyrimidine kinase/phosphomethylpyrimidine kinase [Candidatus Glassbacteria bacterium]